MARTARGGAIRPVVLVVFAALWISPSQQFAVPLPGAPCVGRPGCAMAALRTARPARGRGSAPLALAMGRGDSIVDKGLDLVLGGGSPKSVSASPPVPGGGEDFCVVVDDDDDHSVEEVVKILRRTTGCSWKDALDRTLRIGRIGNAVVYRSTSAACEQMADDLKAATLKARLEPASADNSPETEKQREAEASKSSSAQASDKGKSQKFWGERTFRGGGSRPRVAFFGGTGRVGAWTIRETARLTKGDIDVVIAGRKQEAADKLMQQLRGDSFVLGGREWATMRTTLEGSAEFVSLDLDDPASLEAAMRDVDLVVHTAGPFQRGEPQVLRAAIATQTPYMDVCDDLDYARKCRELDDAAKLARIPAVTTGGIYPGLSNVMAAALVRKVVYMCTHVHADVHTCMLSSLLLLLLLLSLSLSLARARVCSLSLWCARLYAPTLSQQVSCAPLSFQKLDFGLFFLSIYVNYDVIT